MTDKFLTRWDPHNVRLRIARALRSIPETAEHQRLADASYSFTASNVEVCRLRNYPQPSSGKALVTMDGEIKWTANGSLLFYKLGLDTATVSGGGSGFNGNYGGTTVVSGLNISDPATVFQTWFSAGGAPTGGNVTYTLTVPGQTAQNVVLTFSQVQSSSAASLLAIQSAIAALTGIGAGQVHVSGLGTASSPWLVNLYGSAAGTTVTISSALTGTGTQTMSLTTGIAQNTYFSNYPKTMLLMFDLTSLVIANATGGTLRIFVGSQFVDVAWNVTYTALKTALEGLSNVGPGNAVVIGAGTSGSPFFISFMPQCPAGSVPVNLTRPVLSVGTVGTQSSASSLTGTSPTATLAYLGGAPGTPWDVVWDIASNGPAGVLEVNYSTARIAGMTVQPLAFRAGVPAAA